MPRISGYATRAAIEQQQYEQAQTWRATCEAVASQMNVEERELRFVFTRFEHGELTHSDVSMLFKLARLSLELRAEKYGLHKTVDA